jgi:NAD(P)-dependent dehydrogenase (short-subunit alcohol dehydrogenase family)
MRLKNRVALVSGMAMGIGEAVAELFAAEGAAVIGMDVNEKLGNAVAARIRAAGGRCLFRVGDVGLEDAVRTVVQQGLGEFGRIDVLANVVGIASEAPVDRLELREWDRLLRVNLTSMYLLSKQVLPGMLAQKRGSIVHITSVQALVGVPGYPHYAAAKGGIISLTRQMAAEYASRGIRVNCIAPGTIETPMNKQVLERSPEPEKLRAAWVKMHPIGRIGLPIDIAFGALYLACDESSFVTGQCLVIDGGLTSCAPLSV